MQYSSIFETAVLEHLRRHFQTSHTIGSKFTIGDEQQNQLLKKIESLLRNMNEQGDLGRVELQIDCGHEVGTDALVSIEDKEAFPIVRDPETEHEVTIQALIANSGDIPKTRFVTVIAGPYGDSGKWGIYTMFPGQNAGKPFPNENQPEDVRKTNEEYWKTHGFLATPEELRSHIAQAEEDYQKAQTELDDARTVMTTSAIIIADREARLQLAHDRKRALSPLEIALEDFDKAQAQAHDQVEHYING